MINSFTGIIAGTAQNSPGSFARADREMCFLEILDCRTSEQLAAFRESFHRSQDDDLLIDTAQPGRAVVTAGPFVITMNEVNQSVSIRDTRTGETTEIWGDPHVDMHAQNADGTRVDWDFKQDLTFQIPAAITGTQDLKIQIRTTFDPEYHDRPTFSDGVVVNYGNDAVRVDGIFSRDNTLAVHAVRDNQGAAAALDGAQADGTVIVAQGSPGFWDGKWLIDGLTDPITTQIIAEIEQGLRA